ncbi:MAG: arginine--tRNA ligase, partial [Candidatus Niyogibacteria bacterium]|nr:arginine--tRNA ligase [Candidatus Niyogibacteria bacterium]
MMIREAIENELRKITPQGARFELLRPKKPEFGDYSTNAALIVAEQEKGNAHDLAERYAERLRRVPGVRDVTVAGSGFVNLFLGDDIFVGNLQHILRDNERYGRNAFHAGEKVIVEYTDSNPFKEFHIGHLMSNAVGEAVARLFEASGAEVRRANYQGDIGLHVAEAIYAMERRKISLAGLRLWGSTAERMRFLGAAYAYGNAEYEKNPDAKAAIERINKELYEKKNPADRIHSHYRIGRAWSLDYFDANYELLSTAFEFYFFESETGERGKRIVEEGLKKGIFEKSDGAVIFRGEKYGLHTRVFLNSEGLPIYEAKELGLAELKRETFPYDRAITVTGNEIIDYFRVVLKAMELLWGLTEVEKIRHLPHGMLRLPEGKMSSRTGNIITADALLGDVALNLKEKVRAKIADAIAVGAVKYSILRQAIGRDIIFDFELSLSFEGDSGPYLQYTHARAHSVAEKARALGVTPDVSRPDAVGTLEKILFAYPDVVLRAQKELAPHHLCTYLIELARAFNHYYAEERIAVAGVQAAYRTALACATGIVLKNGLNLLGIQAP